MVVQTARKIVRRWFASPPAVRIMARVLIDPESMAITELFKRSVSFRDIVREPPCMAVLSRALPITAVMCQCRCRCLCRSPSHIVKSPHIVHGIPSDNIDVHGTFELLPQDWVAPPFLSVFASGEMDRPRLPAAVSLASSLSTTTVPLFTSPNKLAQRGIISSEWKHHWARVNGPSIAPGTALTTSAANTVSRFLNLPTYSLLMSFARLSAG